MNKIIFILVILFIVFYLQRKKDKFEDSCIKVQIDKVFVLSMKKSVDRRNGFIKSYKQLYNQVPLEIIWGVDTKDPKNAEPYRNKVDPYKFEQMYDLDSGKKERLSLSDFNSGALGCYLGHMTFYEKCFEQNIRYALICEDNLRFYKNFKMEMILPSDFDIVFFHSWNNVGQETNNCVQGIKKLKKVMGTKCYLINVESMKKYYPLFFPIDNHIDLKYKDLIQKGCNVYFLPLDTISVDSTGGSTIGHSPIKTNLGGDPNSVSHKLFESE
jgi:GR25 family glycosyltransferase involved in LPS biosynthesis